MPAIDPPLLISDDESIALSLHRAQLAVYRIATGQTELIALPDSSRLVAGRGHAFAVVGTGPDTPVTIRTYAHPDRSLVTVRIKGYPLEVAEGDPELLGELPDVVVLDPASVLYRSDGVIRLRRLNSPLPEWATDPEAVCYGAACPDGRHALLCGYRHDGEVLIWDAQTGRIDARVSLPRQGVMCGAFRPGHSELWIGQIDTLARIDTDTWQVTHQRRLRNQPTGSFIQALAFDSAGQRLAIGYSLRSPRPIPGTEWPWYAPSGGQLLVLDPDHIRVTDGLDVDRWLTELAWLSDGRVVAREWSGRGLEVRFRVIVPQPREHRLYPPRAPGDWNWI